jgi:YHS domain-containing protein
MNNLALAALLSLAACTQSSAATPPVAAAPTPVAATNDPPPIAVGTKMKCAVTGEEFTVKPSTVQVVYNGKRYAFCCADCKPEFDKNPAKFAK